MKIKKSQQDKPKKMIVVAKEEMYCTSTYQEVIHFRSILG